MTDPLSALQITYLTYPYSSRHPILCSPTSGGVGKTSLLHLGSQMISLRSKLHLARQGRKSSLSVPPCLDDKCDAAILTQPVGSSSTSSTPRPNLEALPDEPLRRVALFCDFDDLLRLRRTCRALSQIFNTLPFLDVSLVSFTSPSFRPFVLGQLLNGLLGLVSSGGEGQESGKYGGLDHTHHTHTHTQNDRTAGLQDPPCPLPQQSCKIGTLYF